LFTLRASLSLPFRSKLFSIHPFILTEFAQVPTESAFM
jgi:hypothetical protein